jgi:3-hydroxyacyl-[acyl-carrier-protein] dehydratase
MRFRMLDRITELVPGERIVAQRKLTGREDYLSDHFPLFPVMPGVLMLEAMYQAAAWLVRATDRFEHSIVRLKEARNVKYSDFVTPGQTLTVTAEIKKREGLITSLTAQGMAHDAVTVSARLVLESVEMSDFMPSRAMLEPWGRHEMREEFERLVVDLPSPIPIAVTGAIVSETPLATR